MLRTNLATRPFYNERLVHLVLVAAAVLIAALTVFNVYELRVLSGRYSQLVRRVGQAEDRAVRLRSDADRARRSIDRKQLEVVAEAAREANGLIDQRTFSWTELLNRLETTLPPEVKIQSIKPSTDREGNLTVTMVVVSRRAEDVEAFVERLEGTGTFHRLFSKTETTNQQGLLEVLLEGQYLPASGQPEAGPAGGPAGARED
jgi:Tfp pilus assembly protein PilN